MWCIIYMNKFIKGELHILKKISRGKKIALISVISAFVPSSADKKREKTEYYANGLLERGGPSTDVFKKSLGKEKTEELFKKVLFGTEK